MRTASSRFRLASMGSAFPRGAFSGTVHSVYPRALNLIPETVPGAASESGLVTILADRTLAHPRSAELAPGGLNLFAAGAAPAPRPPAALCFDALGLRRGMGLRGVGETLLFDGGFSFSLSGATRRARKDEQPPEGLSWDRALIDERGLLLEKAQAAAGTELRWSQVATDSRDRPRSAAGASFVDLLIAAARETMDALSATSAASAAGAAAPARAPAVRCAAGAALNMVGLGPGLTPAGDDFLCGLMLALRIRSALPREAPGRMDPRVIAQWLKLVMEAADGQPKRTTDVSLVFLRLAREGVFSQALLALAATFRSAASDAAADADFEAALAVLGRLGHSSGYDSATGILYGLSYCEC